MKKRLLLLLFISLFTEVSSFSQAVKPSELVKEALRAKTLTKEQPFRQLDASNSRFEQIDNIGDYTLLDLNTSSFSRVLKTDSEFLEFRVPTPQNESVDLQLVEVDLFEDGRDYVVMEPGERRTKVDTGKHYRGVVKGKENSTLVSMSFYDNQVVGFVAGVNDGNFVIGKMKDSSTHIVYDDSSIARKNISSYCSTPNKKIPYTKEELQPIDADNLSRVNQKCVRLYIEVDYNVYRAKGSKQETSTFMTGLMNQVMTLYANEQIKTKLMPMYIWDRSSPYSGSGSIDYMYSFQRNRSSWEGDLAQLVHISNYGGVAPGLRGICSSSRSSSMCYGGISSSYKTLPTYSWSVMVVAHEYGHLFGSNHTHACVWNGNGTAIDSCTSVEGSCRSPGSPSDGGTVMSYCHFTTGINLSKGFGEQPGDVIRRRVSQGSCLETCSDDGGGGDDNDDGDPNPPAGDSTSPSAPSNLSASNITTSTVNLSWTSSTDNVGVKGYYMYLNGQKLGMTSSTSTVLKSLREGTSYEVYLIAVDAAGNLSQRSNTASFKTLEGKLGAPINLKSTETTSTSTKLLWEAPSGTVMKYGVYVNGVKFKESSQTTIRLDGLRPETSYNMHVTAFSMTNQESNASNSITVVTASNGPKAPKGLQVESTTGTGASFSWTASVSSAGISKYDIYVNGQKFTESTSTSGSVTGLREKTQYSAFVRAIDVNGKESEPSNVAQFTTGEGGGKDSEPPSTPQGVRASNVTSTGADLSWTASKDNVGVVGYKVYVANQYLTTVTTTGFKANNLRPATTYKGYVTAVDAAGNESKSSDVVTFTTLKDGDGSGSDTTPPTAPTALQASGVQSTSASLSWSASGDDTGVVGYKIYVNGSAVETSTTPTKVLSGLKPSASYAVYVTAVDAAGNESRQSNTVNFSTPAQGGGGSDSTPPTAPSNLQASNILATSFVLNWSVSNDDKGVVGYNIYINGTKLSSSVTNTKALSGVRESTSYTIYVTAVDAAGNESRASNTINVTTKASSGGDTVPPTAPSNLETTSVEATKIGIRWSASTDAQGSIAGYDIYINGQKLSSSKITSKLLVGFSAKTTYQIYVRAIDAAGNQSQPSNTITVTTSDEDGGGGGGSDTSPPTQPLNLIASNVLTNSVDLRWTASTDNVGVSYYRIYLNGKLGGQSVSNSSSLSNLDTGTSFSIYVTAVDAAGNESPPSNLVTIKTKGTPPAGSNDEQAPSTPQNLSAYDVQESSAKLAWGSSTDNKGVVAYQVYVNGVKKTTVPNAAAVLSGLTPKTTYTVYVKALDAAGNESTQSNTAQFTTLEPDTTRPSAPMNLEVSNIETTTADLSWAAATDNIGVVGYAIYLNGKPFGKSTGTSFALTNLTSNLTYRVSVKALDAAGNESASSEEKTFKTKYDGPQYCEAQGGEGQDCWVAFVGLNNIQSATGYDGPYSDFTSQVINLPYGSNAINYRGGSPSVIFTGVKVLRIWIDYNQDGDFNDTGELIGGGSQIYFNITTTFTVPQSAKRGPTRMRVAVKNYAIPNACGDLGGGEVEDYTVDIGAANTRTADDDLFSDENIVHRSIEKQLFEFFPNPSREGKIILGLDDPSQPAEYQILTSNGELVKQGQASLREQIIDVSDLSKGIYLLQVIQNQSNSTKTLVIQ